MSDPKPDTAPSTPVPASTSQSSPSHEQIEPFQEPTREKSSSDQPDTTSSPTTSSPPEQTTNSIPNSSPEINIPSTSTLFIAPTPLPSNPSEPNIPGAPARAPPLKTLPAIDVTEFDPFATPSSTSVSLSTPGPSGSSGSTLGKGKAEVDTPVPQQNNSDTSPLGLGGSISQTMTSSFLFSESVGPGRSITPETLGDNESRGTEMSGRSSGANNGAEAEGGNQGDKENQKSDADPAFNFSGFLKDLRSKSADPVARYLKSFLNNFAKKPFTVNEQIKLIRDFLCFIEEKMRLTEPWKSQSPGEMDNALEAMEKLVMNRLYPYTFTPQLVPSQPITTDDLERDSVFAQRVRLFNWVREKHLDVPEGEAAQGFLGFAEQELLKINHYKAPRDKMICILNCCKVIFGLIRHTQGAEATSADAFVPILIFVVLRANPDNLPSNVEYISRFRNPNKLQGEAGYYLSSLTGAIAFIETMDHSSLSNITQAEFESNVEKAIQELPLSPTTRSGRLTSSASTLPPVTPGGHSSSWSTSGTGGADDNMSPFSTTAPGEEAARPLRMMPSPNVTLGLDGTRRFFARTGTLAQEAVSKPISAIGKILEGIQQQQAGSGDESVSGSEEEGGLGGGGESGSGSGIVTPIGGRRRRRNIGRGVTPESPSRRFAQLGISPDSRSIPGTPLYEPIAPPDFSQSEIQQATDSSQVSFDQVRLTNVQTLHQMFPALDEDIVEAVLVGCGDDLGVAIDRLLEM